MKRGLRVLITHDQNAGPRVTYDTIDIVNGPPKHKKTKVVDREPIIGGNLEDAASRLLSRIEAEV